MPRTYLQDLEQISEVFPGMGQGQRDAKLWRAIVDICNENDLSFMIGEGRITVEAPYKTGTVQIVGTTATLTGGTWDTTWTGRKIRAQGREESYTIASFPTTTTATLTESWPGSTDAGLTYFIYRDVYPVPADCELTKELLLFDPVHKVQIAIVDYAEFRAQKRQQGVILGIPTEVARIGLTAAGLPQIEFGPCVPDSARVYLLDYYRSPQKPATRNSPMSPAWPTAFEDVRVKRVLWEVGFAKGHPRRFEFEESYKRRIWEMRTRFDGGNEMRRRVRGTYRRSFSGMTIHARLA